MPRWQIIAFALLVVLAAAFTIPQLRHTYLWAVPSGACSASPPPPECNPPARRAIGGGFVLRNHF